MHAWNLRKFRKFPVGLGSDRNDFHVETRGSERTDCTELGFQHYVVLNPGDGTGDGSQGSRVTRPHCPIGTRSEWWKRLMLFHKIPLTPPGPVPKSIPQPQFSHICEESSLHRLLNWTPLQPTPVVQSAFLYMWEAMIVQRGS